MENNYSSCEIRMGGNGVGNGVNFEEFTPTAELRKYIEIGTITVLTLWG